jgi:hypothetical protein
MNTFNNQEVEQSNKRKRLDVGSAGIARDVLDQIDAETLEDQAIRGGTYYPKSRSYNYRGVRLTGGLAQPKDRVPKWRFKQLKDLAFTKISDADWAKLSSADISVISYIRRKANYRKSYKGNSGYGRRIYKEGVARAWQSNPRQMKQINPQVHKSSVAFLQAYTSPFSDVSSFAIRAAIPDAYSGMSGTVQLTSSEKVYTDSAGDFYAIVAPDPGMTCGLPAYHSQMFNSKVWSQIGEGATTGGVRVTCIQQYMYNQSKCCNSSFFKSYDFMVRNAIEYRPIGAAVRFNYTSNVVTPDAGLASGGRIEMADFLDAFPLSGFWPADTTGYLGKPNVVPRGPLSAAYMGAGAPGDTSGSQLDYDQFKNAFVAAMTARTNVKGGLSAKDGVSGRCVATDDIADWHQAVDTRVIGYIDAAGNEVLPNNFHQMANGYPTYCYKPSIGSLNSGGLAYMAASPSTTTDDIGLVYFGQAKSQNPTFTATFHENGTLNWDESLAPEDGVPNWGCQMICVTGANPNCTGYLETSHIMEIKLDNNSVFPQSVSPVDFGYATAIQMAGIISAFPEVVKGHSFWGDIWDGIKSAAGVIGKTALAATQVLGPAVIGALGMKYPDSSRVVGKVVGSVVRDSSINAGFGLV